MIVYATASSTHKACIFSVPCRAVPSDSLRLLPVYTRLLAVIQPNPSSNNLMQKNPPAASETPCPACPSGRRLRPIDYCGADFG